MSRRDRILAALSVLLLLTCFAMAGCSPRKQDVVRVYLDDDLWAGGPLAQNDPDPLRVYITLDGKALIDLPFGQAHTIRVVQADGSENTIELTGELVHMLSATCKNQDCVNMGEVTRDNYELRALGGFIICLPQKVSVEVRGD